MNRVLFLSLALTLGSSYALASHPAAQPPADKAPAMNQMEGTIQSVDSDNRVIRLQTENGFNVEFSYDRETVCKGIGLPTDVTSLAYKDQVIIRYAGRDLVAREIEKRSLQPAMAASSPTLPAN